MKCGAYIVNLDEQKSVKTHWIALYVNDNSITYFGSSGFEHILKEIKKIIDNKNNITNISKIQTYDSV